MLDVAISAHEAGLCVLPPKQDGSKRPLKAWEQYANTSSTIEEVKKWYSDEGRSGIGIVLGAASGGLECFEFDDMDAYKEFLERAEAAGLSDLIDLVESGYLESSPNGIHWLYRCSEVSGNTKLAQKPEGVGLKVLIETRGQGGYAIVAPSHGDVHPSGKPYKLQRGGFSSIVTISPEQRDSMWSLARSMDRKPVREAAPSVPPATKESITGERPGEWFDRTKTWEDVLVPHGWTFVFQHGTESYWRRPGKDRDYSATTNYQNSDTMKVFSSSTVFDPERSYSKFAAYAMLEHNGNFSAAAKAIFPSMPKEVRHLGVVPDRHESAHPSDHVPSDEAGSAPNPLPKVGDSWKKVDLASILTGEIIEANKPTMLAREDGTLLLYPGKLHEFKGLPEAGKGWLALMACRQELRAGNTVAYVDLEDHPEGIIERLLAMNVTHQAIEERFLYFHPEEQFGDEARAEFFAEIRERKPSIVIIDSVAEMMASNGMDPLSNKDAAEFINMLPRPLSLLGPAVVLIDHLTKQNDNTRFSIGAQHKLAAVDGASYVVEAEEPFGRGRKGSSRIAVVKDRPGHVRRYAESGRYIGRLVVNANDEGTLVDAQLLRPLSQTIEGVEIATEMMGEVFSYIESQGRRSCSGKEIRAAVKGRNEIIDLALEALVQSGYLFRDAKGPGKPASFMVLKTYEG